MIQPARIRAAEMGVPFAASESSSSGEKKEAEVREKTEEDAQQEDALEDENEDAERDDAEPETVMDRVLSRTSVRTIAGPPPDGGFRAWLTCGCVHLAIMNTWGVINSFGTFESYYTTTLGKTPSQIAWIGSFQIFLLFFIGTFTGRLTDAGYFRALISGGIALQMLGIYTTAQGTQYWQLFLSQGVVTGLGNGCIFCPCLAVLSTYFQRRRGLALGLAACGSSTGGLVYPSIVRQLLPQLGFPWTVRIIGFIQFVTMMTANIGIRPRLPPRRTGQLVEWGAFRELPYTFYAAGAFFSFWGIYVAFFYIASFSRDIIGLSYTDSLNLLLLLNGIGLVGRIGPNFLADRYGPLNLFLVFGISSAAVALCWMAVRTQGGLYGWTVVYGIVAGGVQSLFPAGLTSLTTDLSKTGVRMGMVFTINSFATLTGSPIAGVAITAAGGAYTGAQLFTGLTLLAGTCFLLAAKVVLSREAGWTSRV